MITTSISLANQNLRSTFAIVNINHYTDVTPQIKKELLATYSDSKSTYYLTPVALGISNTRCPVPLLLELHFLKIQILFTYFLNDLFTSAVAIIRKLILLIVENRMFHKSHF